MPSPVRTYSFVRDNPLSPEAAIDRAAALAFASSSASLGPPLAISHGHHMNRRQLLALPLVTALPALPVAASVLDGVITIPSDGDPAISETVVEALRELMENSVYERRPVLFPGAIQVHIKADSVEDLRAQMEQVFADLCDRRGGHP